MRVLYINCPYGLDEKRLLDALLDAGVDANAVRDRLSGHLPEPDALSVESLAALAASLQLGPFARGILKGIVDSLMVETAEEQFTAEAQRSRRRAGGLGKNEKTIHHRDTEKTNKRTQHHGGGDVWDRVLSSGFITAAAVVVAIDLLDVTIIQASPLSVPHAAPGELSLPPALARMAVGVSIEASPVPGLPVTAIGLALLAAAASSYGPMPPMTLIAAGSGTAAGPEEYPTVVQVFLGERETVTETDRVTVLETNIDDMPGQNLDYVMQQLFEAGALDVYFTPIQMKKNRPAVMLSAICAPEGSEACLRVMMRETTTLGVRIGQTGRRCLAREILEAPTAYGVVPVKVALLDGRVRSVMPEYDVCQRLAREAGVPLREIQEAASAAAREALELLDKEIDPL